MKQSYSRPILHLNTVILLVIGAGAIIGCSGGGGSSSPLFDPDVPPRNVQVVAGTGGTSGPQNTVSWNPTTAATDYVVYWDDAPGVTDSSQVLFPNPTNTTTLTHVGLTPGTSYYYRVQARSNSQASVLSDEVIGIPQSAISVQNLLDVIWNSSNRLVAVGNSGLIIYSPNGTTQGWNFAGGNPVANTNVTLAGIAWDGAQFIAVGGGGTVLTSDDGDIWSIQDSQVNIDLEAIVWTGSQFVAVGGSATILTSPDGVSWTQAAVPSVVTGSLRSVTANDNLIVAVGNNGAILTSTDGVIWTARASGTSSSLEDTTWFDDQFVVAGTGDTLLVSLDGMSWADSGPETSGISYFGAANWPSSLLPNPLWVVGGSSGAILTSSDAAEWQALPSGTDNQLNGITWMEDQSRTHIIVVGNEGTVLTNIR